MGLRFQHFERAIFPLVGTGDFDAALSRCDFERLAHAIDMLGTNPGRLAIPGRASLTTLCSPDAQSLLRFYAEELNDTQRKAFKRAVATQIQISKDSAECSLQFAS